MPAWIHERAEHILAKNPKMPKSMGFAIATQQSHATGKTPKGYGTRTGKVVAKAKYDAPKKLYTKTPNPQNLNTPKLSDKPKTRWTGSRLVKKGVAGGLAASEGKKPSDFDPKQVAMGMKVEAEHTSDPEVQKRILADHLTEIPDYYTRLKKMEEAAKDKPKGVDARITEFFEKHPSPSDRQVHAFAEKQGINEHRLEEKIYRLFAKNVAGSSETEKKAALSRVSTLSFVDEMRKYAYYVSEFSGPLSYGSFKQESYIPPFRSPRLKTGGPPSQKKGSMVKEGVSPAWVTKRTLRGLYQRGFRGYSDEPFTSGLVKAVTKDAKSISRSKEWTSLSPAEKLDYNKWLTKRLKGSQFGAGSIKTTTRLPAGEGPPMHPAKKALLGGGAIAGTSGAIGYAVGKKKKAYVRDRLKEASVQKAKGLKRAWQLLRGSRIKPLEEAEEVRKKSFMRETPLLKITPGPFQRNMRQRRIGKSRAWMRLKQAKLDEIGDVSQARLIAGLGALGTGAAAATHVLKKQSAVFSPMSQLRASQKVGKPKMSALPGPSIAQVAKPKGFGQVLSGAGKNFL